MKEVKQSPIAPHPYVSSPMRAEAAQAHFKAFKSFFSGLAARFPALKGKLTQAAMPQTPAEYVAQACYLAVGITAVLLLLTLVLFNAIGVSLLMCIPLIPVYLILMFYYAMAYPDVKLKMRAKRIDQELVFAGRHMQISLKAGVPLFNAMLGITRDYGEVSEEFNKIVEKVTLGVSVNVALHEAAAENPSAYFRRLVLQLVNALSSGSDVEKGLGSVLDQISREQAIALRSYGQKLNPLVMFFMIFGVVLPSLGVAFMIILLSFIGGGRVNITPTILGGFLLLLATVQFLFLGAVENSRPKFDIIS